jgi:hypothetical protein
VASNIRSKSPVNRIGCISDASGCSVARGRDGLHALAIVPQLRGRLVLAWRTSGPMSPAARVLVDKARRLLRVTADA